MNYHPGYTVFVDTRIEQKWFGDHKSHGFVANQEINAGEIIIVEYLMVILKDNIDFNDTEAMMSAINRIERWKTVRDAKFAQVWKAMGMNSAVFNFFSQNAKPDEYLSVINSVKFHTNHFGAFSDRKLC